MVQRVCMLAVLDGVERAAHRGSAAPLAQLRDQAMRLAYVHE